MNYLVHYKNTTYQKHKCEQQQDGFHIKVRKQQNNNNNMMIRNFHIHCKHKAEEENINLRQS